jgi:MFS family permease
MLRNLILAVTVVGLFAYNFTVTLPLLARLTFHEHSASAYGVLMASMGAGAVVGGLLVAHRSRPTPRLLALLTLGFGVFMTSVALAPSILWAEILLAPMGACSIALISTANATLQLNSSEQMRGRVMSLYAIAFLGTTPIGAPLVGLIISWSNPRFGIGVGAVLAIATGIGLIATLKRDERNIEVLRETQTV